MPMKRVMRLLGVAAIAPLFLASCDSGNTFDPFEDAIGTYELSVYAGSAVPVTFPCSPGQCGLSNGGTFRVNDGTLVLYDDGTFVETNHYTTTPTGGSGQPTTFISTGTYDISGDDLTLYAPAQNGIGERFIDARFLYGDTDVRIAYTEDQAQYEYRR